jgi:membrane associated rhomboid family serine protease
MFFFFPLRDEYRVKHFPFIISVIIAANIFLFLLHATGPNYESIIMKYGFIPDRFSVTTLFTSMFLHGGLLHLGFNMWYLWLFGNNIEDRWGIILFLLFYLSAGVFSMLLYSVLIPEKLGSIPTIGASGAISAVLGAYAVLFPKTRITFKYLIWLFIFFIRFGEFKLYAYFWLAFWFVQQAFSTFLVTAGHTADSVAFGAHLSGFLYGVVIGFGTRLYREVRFRENVQLGENVLFKLLGGKQFKQRTIEEYGEIESLKAEVIKAIRTDNDSDIVLYYTDLVRKYPEVTMDEKTQYRIAESLEKQNSLQVAFTAYRNFILNYPFSKFADKAFLSIGKILLETGDEEKAKYAFLQIVLFYPYSDVYEEAKYYLDYKLGNRS